MLTKGGIDDFSDISRRHFVSDFNGRALKKSPGGVCYPPLSGGSNLLYHCFLSTAVCHHVTRGAVGSDMPGPALLTTVVTITI